MSDMTTAHQLKLEAFGDANARRIVNEAGEVVAMALRLANGRWRLFDVNEQPLCLRWFENTERTCTMCQKRAVGILRGSRNESYDPHCKTCAEKRLKASEKVRASLATEPKS